MERIAALLSNRGRRKHVDRRGSLLVLLLALAVLPATAAPERRAVALANADFEQVARPAPTEYGCCFADWLFAVRSGAYGLTAHEADARGTYARLTSRGEAGRADLMSPTFKLKPFTVVRVRARVRCEGATGVVALHPPRHRRQVDLALLEGRAEGWREVDVELTAAATSGDYRVTFGIVGEGYVEVDDVRVDLVGRGERAKGKVVIVDLNDRAGDYERPKDWWITDDLEAIWGYEVAVWSYHDLTARRLRQTRPVALILSPYAGTPPPGDAKARKAARKATYSVLKKTHVPTLGICLGCQWLGWSEGVSLHSEGERGDVVIERLRKDPIFDGLAGPFPCSQSHRFALVRVPSAFHHLGRSETTEVHVIMHKRRLVYGFQGHFERGWEDTTPHGRVILENFLRLAEKAGGRRR